MCDNFILNQMFAPLHRAPWAGVNSLLGFGLLAATLTVFSLVVVLRPLLRSSRSENELTDQDRRLIVLRDRKAEIEADQDAGRLSAADASAAIERLAVELSETLPIESTAAPSMNNHSDAVQKRSLTGNKKTLLAGVIGVLLPLASVGLYLILGAPRIMTLDPAVARGETTPSQVAQAIVELKQRSKKDPGDLQAWMMLAQAHRIQGELDEAIAAYQKAGALAPSGDPETARLLAEHAEALLMKRQGDFAGEPIALLERALQNNPDDQKALGLMGAGLYRLGKPEQGIGFLRKLMSSLPPDSEQSRQIGAVIQRIESELASAAANPAKPANPANQSNTAEGSVRTQSNTVGSVIGQVRIADTLLSKLPTPAIVFMVARPADGQRMPVAVSRQQFSSQPFEFRLTDEQSMTAERKLSSFDSVIIEVRLSASGNAIRQSGDLFGVSKPIKPGSAAIELLIDQVVP